MKVRERGGGCLFEGVPIRYNALGVDACSRKYGILIHRESGMKIGIRATLTVRENEQICECLFSNPNGIACNMFTGQAAFTSLNRNSKMTTAWNGRIL